MHTRSAGKLSTGRTRCRARDRQGQLVRLAAARPRIPAHRLRQLARRVLPQARVEAAQQLVGLDYGDLPGAKDACRGAREGWREGMQSCFSTTKRPKRRAAHPHVPRPARVDLPQVPRNEVCARRGQACRGGGPRDQRQQWQWRQQRPRCRLVHTLKQASSYPHHATRITQHSHAHTPASSPANSTPVGPPPTTTTCRRRSRSRGVRPGAAARAGQASEVSLHHSASTRFVHNAKHSARQAFGWHSLKGQCASTPGVPGMFAALHLATSSLRIAVECEASLHSDVMEGWQGLSSCGCHCGCCAGAGDASNLVRTLVPSPARHGLAFPCSQHGSPQGVRVLLDARDAKGGALEPAAKGMLPQDHAIVLSAWLLLSSWLLPSETAPTRASKQAQ